MFDIDRILSFHCQGFERFVKPIDGNADYESLLAGRLDAALIRDFSSDQPLEVKRRRAYEYSRSVLEQKSVYTVALPEGKAVCYGSTKNNLREFAWFDRLCARIGMEVSSNNLHAVKRSKCSLDDAKYESWIGALLSDIATFYGTRDSITASLVYQQLQYTRTFLSLLVTLDRAKGAALPSLVVLANDHAPAHVAVSMAMKGANIPRLYLQHAEVTNLFPPLDFEYSVLRNERSKEIYASLGPLTGKVYVISRFETPFQRERLGVHRGGQVKVVIYPTARIKASALCAAIEKLAANPAVENIYVKPHPNTYPPFDERSVGGLSVAIVKELPDFDHIAIVGNSSVAVELLHRGIPVYQNFDFDPVEPDYYGFVREGITPAVSLEELATPFWVPYRIDDRWIAAYGKLNPAAQPGHSQTVEDFVGDIRPLAATRPHACFKIARASGSVIKVRQRARRLAKFIATAAVNTFPRAAVGVVGLCVQHTKLANSYRLVPVTGEAQGNVSQHQLPALPANAPSANAHDDSAVERKKNGATASPATLTCRLFLWPLIRLIKAKPDWAMFFVRFALGYTCLAECYKLESIARGDKSDLQALMWGVEGNKLALAIYTLEHVDQPCAWLTEALDSGVYAENELILAIDTITKNRSVAVRRIFAALETLPPNSILQLWCAIRYADWARAFPSLAELRKLASRVYEYKGVPIVRQSLELGLLQLIVRAGEGNDIAEFFRNCRLQPGKLSVKLQLEILRKLQSCAGFEDEALRLRKSFEQAASPFHLLKFKNFDLLTGAGKFSWSHAAAERDFIEAAPAVLSKEFREIVQPAYEQLRKRLIYIDIRIHTDQRRALLTEIDGALEAQNPYSLVRLGDGEGYLFVQEGKYFSLDDARNRERHWWGLELPTSVREEVIRSARISVANADVIGVPAVYRFIRDLGDTSRSMLSTIQGRGLIEVLRGVGSLASAAAKFTEDRANVALFQHVEDVLTIAKKARHVVLVSSVQSECVPKALRETRNFVHVAIPTHNRTALNDSYHPGAVPLPMCYTELLPGFMQQVGPGVLVLVAGGVVGKIFIGAAKSAGAVALDIGGAIDDWASSALPTLR